MSGELFSYRVKAEAAAGITGKKKCDAALLGMLLFCRELTNSGVLFQTENPDVRDLFIRLVSHAAGEGSVTLTKKKRQNRPSLYSMKIKDEDAIQRLFERVGMGDIPETRSLAGVKISDKNLGAFAAGVFQSCGSVVEPTKGYHLEFVAPTFELCRDLCTLFTERLGIEGGMMTRRSANVLYFKESEHIEDLLTLIGAPRSSLELMNVKIYKDIRNHANRATNCDTANLGRQNRSAQRQIEAIRRIEASDGGLSRLPQELEDLARLRLEHPDMSLNELMNVIEPPISRSGLNHRLARIEEIAKEIENA